MKIVKVTRMPSNDDLPIDGIPLDEIERAKHEYGLDDKQARALLFIRKGLPIKDFTAVLTEELWVREVLKDLEASTCRECRKHYSAARSKALDLFGQYMGILGNKSKKKMNRTVTFD